MAAYLYMIKMRILVTLAYRFEVFAAAAANLVMMFATVFLWRTAYQGGGAVEGLTGEQMTTYSIVSVLLSSIFITNVQRTINQKVRQGSIAIDFLRPVDLMTFYLSEDIGNVISALANKFIPLLIISSIIFGPPLPVSITAFLVFLVSCILSFLVLWLLSASVGLIAFWVMELGNMGLVKDAIVKILSGSLVPIWFFPREMQNVLKYLPFQYIYQTPLGIFIGKTPVREGVQVLGIQFAWVLILWLLLRLFWSRARKNTLVQGG